MNCYVLSRTSARHRKPRYFTNRGMMTTTDLKQAAFVRYDSAVNIMNELNEKLKRDKHLWKIEAIVITVVK